MWHEAGRARNSAHSGKIGKSKLCCADGNDVAVVEHIEKLEPEALCERYVLCDARIKRDTDR